MWTNNIGSILRATSFGESHGAAMGVVIDGVPAGLEWDQSLLEHELKRRRPGQSTIVSDRKEADMPVLLSGVFENKTLGTPICVIIHNKDHKSSDYKQIKDKPRVGHADDLWFQKFGHSDYRGGGRASGRETVSRVIMGAVGKMILNKLSSKTKVCAYVNSVGSISLSPVEEDKINNIIEDIYKGKVLEDHKIFKNFHVFVDQFLSRMPSEKIDCKVIEMLEKAKLEGQSFGGAVSVKICQPPKFIGEPVFGKLKALLSQGLMSIGTSVSFEIGDSDFASKSSGKDFHNEFDSSHYAGIRGGISTGENININLKFKPPSSLGNIAKNGRHDPCILPRVVPVVEAMVNFLLADLLLLQRLNKIE